MERVLLLNGSHSELMLLHEIKKLGAYVITTGNLPEGIAHKYADKYIQADYSDCELMLDIAKKENITRVVSCANDFGIITASFLAEKIGFSGYDSYKTTLLLHQKDLFKHFAKKNKLKVPYSKEFSNIIEAINEINNTNYPVIIKPADLTGGKGVSLVKTSEDYELAIKKAFNYSRKKVIVVEKFIEGTYHSFSTFLVNRKVIAYYSDDEYSNVYNFFVDTSIGPASCTNEIKYTLINEAEKVAKTLNLVDGIFHMQYVMDKDKNPFIIDITRRCSGDMYPEPVEHSTGIPWSKWIIMSEMGYTADAFFHRGEQKKLCGRHCIMAETEGIIKNVIISDEFLPYIYKDIQWWKLGDEIKNHLVDKAGIIFYEFPNRDIMRYFIKNIKYHVKIELI